MLNFTTYICFGSGKLCHVKSQFLVYSHCQESERGTSCSRGGGGSGRAALLLLAFLAYRLVVLPPQKFSSNFFGWQLNSIAGAAGAHCTVTHYKQKIHTFILRASRFKLWRNLGGMLDRCHRVSETEFIQVHQAIFSRRLLCYMYLQPPTVHKWLAGLTWIPTPLLDALRFDMVR